MSAPNRLRGRCIPKALSSTRAIQLRSAEDDLCWPGNKNRESGRRRVTTRPAIRADVVTESSRPDCREISTGLKISADSFGELPPAFGHGCRVVFSHKDSRLKCCF
jgi:hypothetical protein